jgi:hypothetical protein
MLDDLEPVKIAKVSRFTSRQRHQSLDRACFEPIRALILMLGNTLPVVCNTTNYGEIRPCGTVIKASFERWRSISKLQGFAVSRL